MMAVSYSPPTKSFKEDEADAFEGGYREMMARNGYDSE